MEATKENIAEKLVIVWQLAGAARRTAGGTGRHFDPTRGKGRVLAMLKIKDGLSTKELASVTGMRVSSMNELLSKLEAAGLVRREASEADGRVMLVYLTEAGRETETGGGAGIDLLAGLTQNELDQLDVILDKMIANAREALGDERWEELQNEWERRREAIASFMESGADPTAFPGGFPGGPATSPLGAAPFPGGMSMPPFGAAPSPASGFGPGAAPGCRRGPSPDFGAGFAPGRPGQAPNCGPTAE